MKRRRREWKREELPSPPVYLKSVVFEEERREAEALIAGKDVLRESFVI